MTLSTRRLPAVAFATLLTLSLVPGCASRASSQEVDQILAALQLRPGMRVADVGAGDGEWSEALRDRVGETGYVYSTEVDEDDVDDLRERFDDAGFENVEVILGDQESTGLPVGCCDAVLLRLVYHHFTDPDRMLADLRRALKPGGRLAVVEITIQKGWGVLPGVPDRGGHGIETVDLLAEMEADGWQVIERHDDWGGEKDHYCVVFH